MRPGRIDRFPPTRTSATRPSEVYALPRETANHADNKRTPFDGVAATTGDRSIHGSSGDGSGGNGKRSAVNANRDQSRAVDLRVAEGGADDRNGEEVARRRPRGQDGAISRSLPPGAEVLEVLYCGRRSRRGPCCPPRVVVYLMHSPAVQLRSTIPRAKTCCTFVIAVRTGSHAALGSDVIVATCGVDAVLSPLVGVGARRTCRS